MCMDLIFDDFVKKYDGMIHSFINRTYVDGYTKDDLYQELLMVLNDSITDFDPNNNAKFSTYLYIRFRNRMYDLIRKNKKLNVISPDSEIVDSIESHYKDDYEVYDKFVDEFSDVILETLDKELKRGYITKMIVFDGFTQVDIAKVEGISQQRVAYLHKRNIKYLKNKFNNVKFNEYWGLYFPKTNE